VFALRLAVHERQSPRQSLGKRANLSQKTARPSLCVAERMGLAALERQSPRQSLGKRANLSQKTARPSLCVAERMGLAAPERHYCGEVALPVDVDLSFGAVMLLSSDGVVGEF